MGQECRAFYQSGCAASCASRVRCALDSMAAVPLAAICFHLQHEAVQQLDVNLFLLRPCAAVTLFEGGRVYGAEVIAELIEELHASVAMGEGFEGEMKNLVSYAR